MLHALVVPLLWVQAQDRHPENEWSKVPVFSVAELAGVPAPASSHDASAVLTLRVLRSPARFALPVVIMSPAQGP